MELHNFITKLKSSKNFDPMQIPLSAHWSGGLSSLKCDVFQMLARKINVMPVQSHLVRWKKSKFHLIAYRQQHTLFFPLLCSTLKF